MANQPQPRPWFRLVSIARPVQPQAPPPVSAPRPSMQPPAAPLPRPIMTRPIFRPPIATQPRPSQEAPRPTQVSRAASLPPSDPARSLPPVTPAAVGQQPPPPPPAFTSRASPPKPRLAVGTISAAPTPVIQRPQPPASPIGSSPQAAPFTQRSAPQSLNTQRSPVPAFPVTSKNPNASPVSERSLATSPDTQKSPTASPVSQRSPAASPVTQRSPAASPVTQRSPATPRSHPVSPVPHNSPPASPVTQKSPPAPRAPPLSAALPSPSKLPYLKIKNQPPSHSMPSSPAMKQDMARSEPVSPAKPLSPSPSSKPYLASTSPTPLLFSPTKNSAPYAEQFAAPTNPISSVKPSNGLINAVRSPTVGTRLATSTASPRAAKPLPETPPRSPNTQHAHPSPPSFSLPPSQLKSDGEHEREIPAVVEDKTVLHAQDTIGKPRSFLGAYGENSGKPQKEMYVKPKERDTYKKAYDSEDVRTRVITISGENTGAVMELGYSPQRHSNPHGYNVSSYRKLNESSDDNLSSSEGRSKAIQGRKSDTKPNPSLPMHAFTNSNVQGINSSIVFNSTLSHHDPGVHLSLPRKPLKTHLKEHANGNNNFQKEGKFSST